MINSQDDLFKDFETVRQISIIPTMLEVICQLTGMGFAAVARVTNDRWLACKVRDEVAFGLKEGEELKVETTLCNEIRDIRQPIIIDNVAEDPVFCNHHTPKIYGLQSYISFPIILKDGTFFGTLCAIDAKPADLNNTKVVGTFSLFTELLSFHLQSVDLLERSHTSNISLQNKNRILTNVNNELDDFVHSASHDLKSPITNIASLVDILGEIVEEEIIDKPMTQQIIGLIKSDLKRFTGTIKDLTTFVEVNNSNDTERCEEINISEVVESVKQDLNNWIIESNANIKVQGEDHIWLNLSKKNFKSILYNLLSNALKYRSPERVPEVLVKINHGNGKVILTVTDNGLGIPFDKQDKIFTMFKRFHNHVEGSGVGLYIVKRMVDNINGQILVNSTLNQGTTITILF
ncbi:sensor histidine kinase [Adhaeribacter radiodurans]|uniref:histidine kinase n=1 Tax=Adhaeribacter radiodurans TaxID=2745197 RepID=A0A7L7L692_9BACT|nr:GAF domain-containing sensor histidine kinase [Adhaeribacter radiodurans]QMU28337.1 GAF domain-containing sensor histidine kinase [Adhaeribacter radiodurans]